MKKYMLGVLTAGAVLATQASADVRPSAVNLSPTPQLAVGARVGGGSPSHSTLRGQPPVFLIAGLAAAAAAAGLYFGLHHDHHHDHGVSPD